MRRPYYQVRRPYYLSVEGLVLGLFNSEQTPQVGQLIEVEEEDSEFREYVVSGGQFGGGKPSEFYLMHPTRWQPLQARRHHGE